MGSIMELSSRAEPHPRSAASHRIGLAMGGCAYRGPAEPTGPFLRLSFVGAGPEGLARGVEILARVMGADAPA